MWPFSLSDMPLETASWLSDAANIVLVASLIAGVLATFIVVRTGSIKERYWENDRQKANKEIAELQDSSAKANEHARSLEKSVAEANARGEEAKAAAAKSLLEQERLKADNLSLQAMLAPRRLSPLVWTEDPNRVSKIYEDSRKSSGTKVFIQYVRDAEASNFAHDIASVLKECGWQPEFVEQSFSGLPDISISEGATIIAVTDGSTHTDANGALFTALWGMNVVQGVNDPPLQQPEFKPNPPETGVFIAIGLKPFNRHFLNIQQRAKYREIEEWEAKKRAIWEQGGAIMEQASDGRYVKMKPGPNGTWVSEDPSENLVVSKQFPVLMLPNGAMISAGPPRAKSAPAKTESEQK